MAKSRHPIAKFLIGLVLVLGVSITILVILSHRAPELQADAGRLGPCPDSPNCVSSLETDDVHGIAPLWTGEDAEAAWLALEDHLAGRRGVHVVLRTPDYMYAEFTTGILRFVDDVEFQLDASGRRIDVRSASRVGHSDFGTNRTRVESLRTALETALR